MSETFADHCILLNAGCSVCRVRKIKCDQKLPTCDNCAKAKWKCAGYRNTIDLLFHDESAKVVRKVKLAKAKSTGNTEAPSKRVTSLNNDRKSCKRLDQLEPKVSKHQSAVESTIITFEQPRSTLFHPLDELAIAYFIHHYTLDDTSAVQTCQTLDSSDCLKAAIVALGAAAVTNSGPGSSCSERTHCRYADALHLTNQALQSPLEVKKDTTLLAVNLLGIFEVKTCSRMRLESWHEHVQGAAALLAYRGAKQFESSEGGRLFMQTVSNMIISSVCRRFEIPSYITNLVEEAAKQIPDACDWDWRCFRLNLRFARLCSRLPLNNVVRSPSEATRIIEEAWKLDQDMVELLDDASDDWHFKAIYTDVSDIFANRIYAFPHYFAAQQYNGILCKRIILQDIMLKILWFHSDISSLQLGISEIEKIRNASTTIREIQMGILRSVPQHLGTHARNVDFLLPFATVRRMYTPQDNMWSNFMIKDQNPWRSRPRQNPIIPTVRTCCGYTIQWPLYIVGAADPVDGELRRYSIQSLRILGENMGLRQAFLLADRLEKGEREHLNAHIEFSKDIMY